MHAWRTYIVSAEDAHDLATAVELNENPLLEVLLHVSYWR